jgi:hypothetical protein
MRKTREKGAFIGRIRCPSEQIIGKLREAEVLLGQSTNIGEAIRKFGFLDQVPSDILVRQKADKITI